jgi:TfoX/Sxy family transcriptional regulator of competence genes
VPYLDKKMFGGLAFMVRNKMCVGVIRQDLMVRIDPALYEKSLLRKGAREMTFTGRPMKGFIFVGPEGTSTSTQLRSWVTLALEFNPRAVSSKKRTVQKKGRRS